MLTVLTQMPPFVSGNSEWTYGHPDGPSRRPFGMCPRSQRLQLPALGVARSGRGLLEARRMASFPTVQTAGLTTYPYL
jgi:hypothetical protein